MIHIQAFEFNPFQENTYIAFDETREAIVVDPGCYERSECQELDNFISKNQLQVKCLVNTHCHIDHVLGNYHVKENYKVPLILHKKEEAYLKAVKAYASNYGFDRYTETLPDRFLEEGETISFGNSIFEILFLPGHSPGHIGLYHPSQKILISGDVLFQGSIGRTDLPGGHYDTLINSIHQKLFILPDDVTVYPGHGPTTTLGEEKITNPFCALSLR